MSRSFRVRGGGIPAGYVLGRTAGPRGSVGLVPASAVVAAGALGTSGVAGGASGSSVSGGSSVLDSASVDTAFGNTQGDILYRNATVWTVLAPGTANQALITGGAGANPGWGTLTVSGGGTGAATLTAHAVLLGEGTSTFGFATIGTAGRVLIDQGAGADPSFEVVSGDGTLSSAGALTVTKTGGVSFATSATTNTTNASNISSGTLAVARGGAYIGTTQHGDINVTLTSADAPLTFLNANLTAARTWTLPLANAVQAGAQLSVADAGGINGANTLSITRQGTNSLFGVGVAANTFAITTQFGSVTVKSDGSANWFIVAKT